MRFLFAILVLIAVPFHLAWASSSECRDKHAFATAVAQSVPASAAAFAELPSISNLAGNSAVDITALVLMAEQFDDWEFFDDDTPHIVDQLSALDLRDVSVDTLSCRVPSDNTPASAGAPDPHEFDLPSHAMVHHRISSQIAFATIQPSLISAPVFRTFRPPMTTTL